MRVIVIFDPPARLIYILDPVSMTAIQRHLSPQEVGGKVEWLFPGRYSTEATHETVEGIECRRIRVSAEARDGGVETLHVWISDELQSVVLEEAHTRDEEYSWRLFDVQREEPDSMLFRLPANYRVITSPE